MVAGYPGHIMRVRHTAFLLVIDPVLSDQPLPEQPTGAVWPRRAGRQTEQLFKTDPGSAILGAWNPRSLEVFKIIIIVELKWP